MSRSVLLPFLVLATALCGCQQPSVAYLKGPGPYVRPGLVMIPADQAHRYRLKPAEAGECHREPRQPDGLSAMDVRSVLKEGTVSVIQYNRYADPIRPDELMHEAHVVYRRDTAPRWRLQPAPAAQQILVGPSVTDGRGEIRALASQELEAYLHEQRATLRQQEHLLGQVAESVSQLAGQQQALAVQLSQIKAAAAAYAPDASDTEEAEPFSDDAPETDGTQPPPPNSPQP